MKKVLKNTPKNVKYLNSLPKIHLIGCWARYGYFSYPFTGRYIKKCGITIPLVYKYDDHNGTTDAWYLIPITYTTTGRIIEWTESEWAANRIAKALNTLEEVENESCNKVQTEDI